MILMPETREMLRNAVKLLDNIPDGTETELTYRGIEFQANSQDDVRRIRSYFPGVFWQKEWVENCKWWSYSTKLNGIPLQIYAVQEAPPTCVAIEEEYEVEENVPVVFEKKIVTKKRLKWDCSGDKPEV
jgi:hypothetical protein